MFPRGDSLLVSFDDALNLTYWDKLEKIDSCRIPVPRDYSFCNSAFLSSDGKLFFFGYNKSIYVWNVNDRRVTREIRVSDGIVLSFALDARTNEMVVQTREKEGLFIRLMDRSGRVIHKSALPRAISLSARSMTDRVAFSSRRGVVVCAGFGPQIQIWDRNTWKETSWLHMHRTPVHAIALSCDEELLTSCGGEFGATISQVDRVVRVWEQRYWKRQVYEFEIFDNITCMTISADKKLFLVGTVSGTIALYEVASWIEICQMKVSESPVEAVAFSRNCRSVAFGLRDGRIGKLKLINGASPISRRSAAMDKCWKDLGSVKAQIAFKAVNKMVGYGDDAVRFLDGKLKPVAFDKVSAAVAELNSDTYEERAKADIELRLFGSEAEIFLEKALHGKRSVEARRRLENIQAVIRPSVARDWDTLQRIRAIWILQQIASFEACKLLSQLARNCPDLRMTREAHAALDYLKR
jgi:hypothetical protein